MTRWQSFKFKRMRKKLEYTLFCNGLGSNHLWYICMKENDRLGIWKRGRLEFDVTRLED